MDELAEEDEIEDTTEAKQALENNAQEVKVKGEEDRVDSNETVDNISSQKRETNGSDEQSVKRQKLGKDPNVRTEFLPDREREEEEKRLREQLKEEWIKEQERVKQETVEITYSYYDGSGHRRSIEVPKGTSIGKVMSVL